MNELQFTKREKLEYLIRSYFDKHIDLTLNTLEIQEVHKKSYDMAKDIINIIAVFNQDILNDDEPSLSQQVEALKKENNEISFRLYETIKQLNELKSINTTITYDKKDSIINSLKKLGYPRSVL